ncbi:Site-specific recombinase and resolvase superfamily protein [Sinorhizobium sp. BJ1]|nr:Site-specific recombinase and resolvase superfamily protein [Sinorhizobium sp. BJ1]
MEMGLRATLSQELIEQIRYRTREGMKTAVRKGKATTCLADGYKLKLAYDGNGDRIPGLRDIDQKQADVIRWIFQQYADGVSPRDIAKKLNDQDTPGPRGAKWRDTAIRGHVSRGTGILNNETYIGRVVWNRRNYRKNPETERRVARSNKGGNWVVNDVPDLRIIDDALWAQVKARQKELGELFSYTTTNRLNAAHRPSYLLSGILECAECGGPYAIMAKDRYGCTNHKKRLPIDDLGGECCQNQKTILRNDVEDRILACLPAAFLHLGIFEEVANQVMQSQVAKLKSQPTQSQQLKAELQRVEQEQKNIIQQISGRAVEGRPRLTALDDLLDQLEEKRSTLTTQLQEPADANLNLEERLAELRAQTNPDTVRYIVDTLLFYLRDHADTATNQPFIDLVRQLVQKVVIGKTPGHQPATLEVHGRIASILAAMEASTILEERFKLLKHHDYLARHESGELDTELKRKKLLDAYAEELSVKRLEWQNIQVSVVAGAGFEPAAFRL